MSTAFERCDKSVDELAQSLIGKHKEHALLEEFSVKIDFVFASADDPSKPALKKNGIRAYGIARKVPLKDRALGRADAEIAIDRLWWDLAKPDERAALLDHELYHLTVDLDAKCQRDDLGRPKIILRKHDVEIGWFHHIAKRYGMASIERAQAKRIWDEHGQAFWPDIVEELKHPKLPFKEAERPKKLKAA